MPRGQSKKGRKGGRSRGRSSSSQGNRGREGEVHLEAAWATNILSFGNARVSDDALEEVITVFYYRLLTRRSRVCYTSKALIKEKNKRVAYPAAFFCCIKREKILPRFRCQHTTHKII